MIAYISRNKIYPLKTSEIRGSFWLFQGIQKENIDLEWDKKSCSRAFVGNSDNGFSAQV